MEWKPKHVRYGLENFERSDGALITVTLTSGGNPKYSARHPKFGLAASDRGYATSFKTAAAAKRWVEKQDLLPPPLAEEA